MNHWDINKENIQVEGTGLWYDRNSPKDLLYQVLKFMFTWLLTKKEIGNCLSMVDPEREEILRINRDVLLFSARVGVLHQHATTTRITALTYFALFS